MTPAGQILGGRDPCNPAVLTPIDLDEFPMSWNVVENLRGLRDIFALTENIVETLLSRAVNS